MLLPGMHVRIVSRVGTQDPYHGKVGKVVEAASPGGHLAPPLHWRVLVEGKVFVFGRDELEILVDGTPPA